MSSIDNNSASGSDSLRSTEPNMHTQEPTRVDRPGLPRGATGGDNRPTLDMRDMHKNPVLREASLSGARVRQVSAGFFLPEDEGGIWEAPVPMAKPLTGLGSEADEYKDAEFYDPLASGRTVKEFSSLIANLDERMSGGNTDQVRMILDEVEPHLILLRPDHVRQIFEACPLLTDPTALLAFLEKAYPKDQEVVPGVSKFQAALRELGKSLSLIFRNIALSTGIEKLRTLAEGAYKYTFIDFRSSLSRSDHEAPELTQELTYWLMKLTPIEKRVITINWRIPPSPEKMVEHLRQVYPPKYHAYILQIFAEKLSSLFAHSSIPDNASPENYAEGTDDIRIKREAQHLAVIWNGELPLPKDLPEYHMGRVTDRIVGGGAFDVEEPDQTAQ